MSILRDFKRRNGVNEDHESDGEETDEVCNEAAARSVKFDLFFKSITVNRQRR